jgi:hypothetical protein
MVNGNLGKKKENREQGMLHVIKVFMALPPRNDFRSSSLF